MTKQQLARRVRDDFVWYAKSFLKIKTKDAKTAFFRLNNVQRDKIEARWQAARDEGRPLRLFILKARRVGSSTHAAARFFHRTATRKNRSALIVAQEDKTAVELFDAVRVFRDELPSPLRPMERYSSRRELVFENPSDLERPSNPGLRSKLSVATSRNVDTGKGTLNQDVLLTEFCFYRAPRAFLDSITPTVPDFVDTSLIIETTADWVGSDGHKLWEASKRGETQFETVFIAWFDDDEYQVPFASDSSRSEFMAALSDEERAAQTAYGLSPEQVQWRRKERKKYDSEEDFLSQYPENDTQCWLASGSGALPAADIRAMMKTATPPKRRGFLETYVDERDPRNPIEKIRFIDDAKGPLSIWKMPDYSRQYVLGADTSEGVPGGDYSCVDVLDKETSEQVAQWHGHIDPDLLGSEVIPNLGWFYNTADAGVERNNDGKTVLVALKNAHYPRIYRSIQVDERTNVKTKKLGWLTTRQSKPLLVNEIRQRFRERSVVINSPETLGECMTFIRLPDGSMEAQRNCKDDRVMSLGVALQVLAHHPFVSPPKRRRPSEPTFDSITGY